MNITLDFPSPLKEGVVEKYVGATGLTKCNTSYPAGHISIYLNRDLMTS